MLDPQIESTLGKLEVDRDDHEGIRREAARILAALAQRTRPTPVAGVRGDDAAVLDGGGQWLASRGRFGAAEARQIWSGQGVDQSGSPSFDGRYLSYTDPGTGDLGVLDLATGATRRLTNTGGWSAAMDGSSSSSALSSDGREVAYVWSEPRSRSRPPDALVRCVDVQQFRLDSGREPFALCLVARGEVSDMELYRVSVAAGTPEKMGISLNGQLQHPQVHPSGRRLAFSTQEQGANEVWALENVLPRAEAGR